MGFRFSIGELLFTLACLMLFAVSAAKAEDVAANSQYCDIASFDQMTAENCGIGNADLVELACGEAAMQPQGTLLVDVVDEEHPDFVCWGPAPHYEEPVSGTDEELLAHLSSQ
jgi:hypothetical protein